MSDAAEQKEEKKELSPAAQRQEAAGGIRTTHFDFQHKVFTAPGAQFSLKGSPKEAMFCLDLGGSVAFIDINTLRREFDIDSFPTDEELLIKAVQGLKYVPDIRPGDEIPSEILDGTASWSIHPKHRKMAEDKIKAQLLSWVSGQARAFTDPEEVATMMEQVKNKEKLKQAFEKAAVEMKLEGDTEEQILHMIELMAREICYIEALREAFRRIRAIDKKSGEMYDKYPSDGRLRGDLQRVSLLLKKGIQEYEDIFDDVDAQSGEIISALKNLDRQIDFIRERRDTLHFLLMEWQEVIDGWKSLAVVKRRSQAEDKVVEDTYRFLVQRFNTARSMLG